MNKINTHLSISGKTNIVASALLKVNRAWDDLFERENIKSGSILIHSGVRPSLVYFPAEGLISILVNATDDPKKSDIQTAMLGDEDIVGLPALMSDSISNYRAIADLDTPVWRVSAQAARRVLEGCEASRAIINRCADLALTEAWQQTASVSTHAVRDRLVAWLLRSAHVAGETSLPFTQPYIAERMGIRRPTVTDLLQEMEGEGLIARERGRIRLIKMEALTAQAAVAWPTMLKHRQVFKHELMTGHSRG